LQYLNVCPGVWQCKNRNLHWHVTVFAIASFHAFFLSPYAPTWIYALEGLCYQLRILLLYDRMLASLLWGANCTTQKELVGQRPTSSRMPLGGKHLLSLAARCCRGYYSWGSSVWWSPGLVLRRLFHLLSLCLRCAYSRVIFPS
jgi:hypothetical protein